MTQRLYYTDAYLASFSAAVSDRTEGGRRVYLDQSAFYPTSGGQPHDAGFLNGIAVLDVIDEEERVAHILAAPLDSDRVEGIVDWPRRFDNMQQHTGQHLLSAVSAELLGADTVSVHFGAETSTVDLAAGDISPGELFDLQDRANAIITENRLVTVTFEDAATATGLRKATDRSGTLRIITIAELDKSACGGTHVRSTGEIGVILLRRLERIRKQVRLEFICGLRATRRARADYLTLSQVATGFSAGVDEAPALVDGLRGELRETLAARDRSVAELALYQARERVGAAAADAKGRKVVRERIAAGPLDSLRPLATAVQAIDGAVFIGASGDPVTILLASSVSSAVDAGNLLGPILRGHGGKGGGSPRMAQGSLPSVEALDKALAALDRALE